MSPRWSILLAALGGGALVVGLQAWLGEEPRASTAVVEAPVSPVEAPEPPAPGDPSAARRFVKALLVSAGVPERAMEEGLYPLKGEGRPAAATLPLISFTCPTRSRCGVLMEDLARRSPAAGLVVSEPRGGDRPDRPRYRALFENGQPVLALRAYPPGPRLTVMLVGAAGQKPPPPSRHLHVTYAIRPDFPEGPERARDLIAGGREVWAALPPSPPGAALTEGVARWLDEGAAGVLLSAAAPVDMDATPWIRFARALRQRGAPFLTTAGVEGPESQPFDLRALSIRGARGTHVLKGGVDLEAQLKRVEAAMVLDGAAVVVAPDLDEVRGALDDWLTTLTRRGTRLYRVSEIVR